MARIRVNTEDLKTKAKDFDSAADAFNRAGDDILAAAMAMPSYDGQLSGPARKAGYEIQTQCRELKAALSNNAESIRKAAQDFENVDNQTINAITQSQESLSTGSWWPEFNPNNSHGTSYLGYNWDPRNPDVIILCMYGECRKVLITDENRDEIQDFILQVDGGTYVGENGIKVEVIGYYDAKDKMEDAFNAKLADTAIIVGAIFGAALITGPTFGAAAAGAAIVVTHYTADLYHQEEAYDKAVKDMEIATNQAATDWNEIFPGENQTGDAEQGTFADSPGEDNDVYEPPDMPYTPGDNATPDTDDSTPETGQYQ